MKIYKIHDNRVLILPIKEGGDLKTKAGIILTGVTSKTDMEKGTIVQLGKNCTEVSEDEVVYYNANSGLNVTLEGIDYLIMRETDLFISEL